MRRITQVLGVFLIGLVLTSCGSSDKNEQVSSDTSNKQIVYTLEYDQHSFEFDMLDGWRKFPNQDKGIAFLVGNKDSKSFMTAGFEEKKGLTLEEYQLAYLEKVEASKGSVTLPPEKRELNGMDSYYLGLTMQDGKGRTLTYRVFLIETEDYFINLGGWTSETKPSEATLNGLEAILNTFKQKPTAS